MNYNNFPEEEHFFHSLTILSVHQNSEAKIPLLYTDTLSGLYAISPMI